MTSDENQFINNMVCKSEGKTDLERNMDLELHLNIFKNNIIYLIVIVCFFF